MYCEENDGGKLSFSSAVESDTFRDVLHHLGAKNSTKTFCILNKACLKRHINVFSTAKPGSLVNGRLKESDGRVMCEVLELLRFAVFDLGMAQLSPAAQRVVKSYNDLYTLRSMNLYGDLMRLNIGVYSYWDRCAGTNGVYQWFIDMLKCNPHMKLDKEVDRDVKYWRDSRVFGDFYLLFDRHDGTVLVSLNYQKVYLVLGLANTVGEALTKSMPQKKRVDSVPTFHNQFLGRKISTTLLNWDDKVVYDGLMMHIDVMNRDQRKRRSMRTSQLLTRAR